MKKYEAIMCEKVYLCHIANRILQVEFMENIKDPISWFLSRPSHQYFTEEFSIEIGPPNN